MKLHKYFFYLTLFLLPVNLGKHFVIKGAYINGRLLDYLVPTVFLVDVLVFITLVLWFFSLKNPLKYLWGKVVSNFRIAFLLLFLVAVFFSVLVAPVFVSSLYFFLKLVLYVLFCIYVSDTFELKKDFEILQKILLGQIFLLSLLAFLQWYKQGAVFNNYLFFGEQPYGYSTQNIIKENFFGVTKIPPYSLFRHPNVFGGYLSITLIWVFSLAKKNKAFSKISLVVLLLGSISLILTLSYIAWFSFLFGAIFVFLLEKFNVTFRKVLFFIGFMTVIFGFFFMPFEKNSRVSLQRRADLMVVNFKMFLDSPLFGVGANNSVVLSEKYQIFYNKARFPQPVHNIFMLLLTESGIFSFVFFMLFLFSLSLKKNKFYLLGISIVQIVILGVFDHYFFTAHQTSTLMWLTFGMSLIQFY